MCLPLTVRASHVRQFTPPSLVYHAYCPVHQPYLPPSPGPAPQVIYGSGTAMDPITIAGRTFSPGQVLDVCTPSEGLSGACGSSVSQHWVAGQGGGGGSVRGGRVAGGGPPKGMRCCSPQWRWNHKSQHPEEGKHRRKPHPRNQEPGLAALDIFLSCSTCDRNTRQRSLEDPPLKSPAPTGGLGTPLWGSFLSQIGHLGVAPLGRKRALPRAPTSPTFPSIQSVCFSGLLLPFSRDCFGCFAHSEDKLWWVFVLYPRWFIGQGGRTFPT